MWQNATQGILVTVTTKPALSYLYTEGRPTPFGWVLIGGAAAGVLGIVALAIMYFTVSVPLPDAAPGGSATEVLDADGELIGTLKGEQKRKIVPLDQISPFLQQAAVATEDRSFFTHNGISPRGMVRALFTNVQEGAVSQGGSTITQQYARNAYGRVGTERTIARKLREIALARRIEQRYSKDKILEFYLNTIYFGRGAYGAEAAALTYFKKPAKDLTLGEAAYLAGAIRSPENYQPDENPEGVVRIRNEVLGDMVATAKLTGADAGAARGEDILAQFKLGVTELDSSKAGYFIEYVRRLLRTEEYGFTDAELLGGGLKLHTSLDLAMQEAAEQAVLSIMNQPEDPEVALIAMDPEGYVRAMIGGRDTQDRVRALGFNFAANVRPEDDGGRQAGSAFKPIALASYLSQGEEISRTFPGPSKITIDNPLCRDGQGQPWTVSNFDSEGYGRLDVARATHNSVNTVYAQMMDEVVTPTEFMDTAGELGISIPDRDEGCALALGTTAVTPLEMAAAFTTFAARGQRPEPVVVTRVTAQNGETLIERRPITRRALDERVADTINQVLQGVVTGGTARSAAIGRPAAGKTGTTQNHVDAWFAGYTPDLTAVVWMGYAPDETGTIPEMVGVRGRRVTGGSFPAAIWKSFMQTALRGTKETDFVDPEDETEVPTAPPTASCPEGTVASGDVCDPAPLATPSLPEFDSEPLPGFTTTPQIPPPPRPSPTRSASPRPSPTPTTTSSPSPSPTTSPTPTAQPGE
ncbi:penicillin-binding protein 1A [soil metagenome]